MSSTSGKVTEIVVVTEMIMICVAACADDADKTEYCDGDHAGDNGEFSGKSRSSTITLAFLIQKTNLTLEDAIVQVVIIDISSMHHCDL